VFSNQFSRHLDPEDDDIQTESEQCGLIADAALAEYDKRFYG